MPLLFDSSEGPPLVGSLFYIDDEYSFQFNAGSHVDLRDRLGPRGSTSLAIGTLQVEVAVDDGTLLFVWGLHPRAAWRHEQHPTPHMRDATIRVRKLDELEAGISESIATDGTWTTTFDPDNGWVRIARPGAAEHEDRCRIASDTAIGLAGSEMNSVWLRPVLDERCEQSIAGT